MSKQHSTLSRESFDLQSPIKQATYTTQTKSNPKLRFSADVTLSAWLSVCKCTSVVSRERWHFPSTIFTFMFLVCYCEIFRINHASIASRGKFRNQNNTVTSSCFWVAASKRWRKTASLMDRRLTKRVYTTSWQTVLGGFRSVVNACDPSLSTAFRSDWLLVLGVLEKYRFSPPFDV